MSLVSTLLQSSPTLDYDTSAIQEGFGYIGDDFLEEAVVALTTDIYAVNETYLTADIIGTCKVVSEGADMNVLLENMVTTGIAKLKAAWIKFLAAIRAFYDKAITFFKSMFLNGEKFAKQFGSAVKDKARTVKSFTYTGYNYDKAAGDTATDHAREAISKTASSFINAMVIQKGADLNKDELVKNLTGKTDKTPAQVVEDVIGEYNSSCSTITELRDDIKLKYRGNAFEKKKITLSSSEVEKMLAFVSKSNETIKGVQKDRATFETNVKFIIGRLERVEKSSDKGKEADDAYKKAHIISQYLTVLMNAYKVPCDTKISMYREIYKNNLTILKMFLNFGKNKKVNESVAFESDDMDVEDMDFDDMDVEEAAVDGADEPEGDTDDIGLVKEGKNCGCDDDTVTEAMTWLNL